MAKFNSKTFNPEAFGKYVERIPKTKKNELIKSRALKGNAEIKAAFSSQTGTAYATLPMKGLLEGAALNYDGQTDITADTTTTFERSVVVIGRSKAWTEGDFSSDITGGIDFMDNVATQVASWWDDVNQDILLAILKGVFSMTGANNLKFVDGHTTDVTAISEGVVTSTTLNSAVQKASGDNKSKFTIAIMHSAVATNLENLKLLKYMTYTDAEGVTRDLTLASWNGRAVIIDDSMPTESIAASTVSATYALTSDTALDSSKTYYTKSGSTYAAVSSPNVANIATYYEKTADAYTTEAYTKYTTYVLGDGAIDHEKIGAKVPYEMQRDPKTNGGQDTLYTRDRFVYAPYGISYTKASQTTLSPTNSELENGSNWTLVHDGATGNARKYIDHKAIPIARIISKG